MAWKTADAVHAGDTHECSRPARHHKRHKWMECRRESLRGELRSTGVRVQTVCPGYVDTALTRGNAYAMPFLIAPDQFAEGFFHAVQAGARYRVIPWQMAIVAKVLRVLPAALFDRLFADRPRKRRSAEP